MAENRPAHPPGPLRRRFERAFDRLGVRPLSLLVFAASVALLVVLVGISASHQALRGIAMAAPVAHNAPATTVVETVHVRNGQLVAAGDILVTLSADALAHELHEIQAELDRVGREAELEALRAGAADDERDRRGLLAIAASLRDEARAEIDADETESLRAVAESQLDAQRALVSERLASRDSLQTAQQSLDRLTAQSRADTRRSRAETRYRERVEELLAPAGAILEIDDARSRYYGSEAAVLEARRDRLLDELARLVIRARTAGRVAGLPAVGSPVSPDRSVASVLPEQPAEVIAYLPADAAPTAVAVGSWASLRGPTFACAEPGLVLRVGGTVTELPAQAQGTLPSARYGRPVFISIPADCPLAVGQVLSIELNADPP